MSLKDKLKERLEATGLSMLQVAKQTGIPVDRMYKWYRQDTQPKHEDAIKIENWLNNANPPDIYTNRQEPQPPYNEKAPELSRALENLTDRGKLDAVSIQNLTLSQLQRDEQISRLLRIMEVSLGIPGTAIVPPGSQPGPDYGAAPSQLIVPGGKKHSKGKTQQGGR